MRNLLIISFLLSLLFCSPTIYANPDGKDEKKSSELLPPPDQEQKKEAKQDVLGYERLADSKYTLNMHKKSFLIPLSYVFNPSQNLYSELESQQPRNRGSFYDQTEAEFQISFFLPVTRQIFHTNWDILMSYTHRSWWQIYNNSWSRPFRETNYTPELFLRNIKKSPFSILGLSLISFDIGIVHESNGQTQTLSRSWDRIFSRAHLSEKTFSLILSTWFRLPENSQLDDNPDIQTFRGYGEIEVSKSFGNWIVDGRLPLARKPGIEVSASYPINDRARLIVLAFHGYGQSLIEYNVNSTRLGIGFSMENFIDQVAK